MKKKYKSLELPQKRYQEIFFEHEYEFSNDTLDWTVYIPHYGAMLNKELMSLTDVQSRYVMGLYGSGALSKRKGSWINLVKKFGREKAKRIMPDTYILSFEKDVIKLSEFSEEQCFILKSQLHRRQGLKIVKGFEELEKQKENYVIAQPLILDLHKFKGVSFNFRAYLLLTSNKGILQGYLYYDANCIYALPENTIQDTYKNNITHGLNPIPDGFPFFMSDLLTQESIDYQTFFGLLANKVNLILQSAASEFLIIENLKEAHCFQVLGVDVLVDANKRPLICEINKGPGMKARNKASGDLKNNMLNDALSVVGISQRKNEGFFKIFEKSL